MKFTFKNHKKPTGLAAIGAKKHIDIKLKGKIVGAIAEEAYDRWRIGFIVERDPSEITKDSRCPWKWIFIKKRFPDEAAARTAVNSDSMKILLLSYSVTTFETE